MADRSTAFLSKDKRIKYFKIECESEVLFSQWQPDGRVYTKQFVMKNVSNKLLTLTYKLPELACFFTPYPDQIILPIGMEHAITVSFQPVAPVEVESCLVFHINEVQEDFKIKLLGELPLLQVTTEQTVIFQVPTAVCEENSVKFPLINTGEVDFNFHFLTNPKTPYSVFPARGELKAGSQLELCYTFQPKESGQIQDVFKLVIEKNNVDALAKQPSIITRIKLTASAKFPFLRTMVNEILCDELVFDQTLVVGEQTQQIFIVNASPLKSHFTVENVVDDYPYNQIQITPKHGEIEANGRIMLKVRYQPCFTGQHYQISSHVDETIKTDADSFQIFSSNNPMDYHVKLTYKIVTRSNLVTNFTTVLKSKPIDLQISHTKIDFGTIKCGTSVQKSLYIKNNSKQDAIFDIQTEGFCQLRGNLIPAVIEQSTIQVSELDDLNRPEQRIIQKFPLKIEPSNGIVASQINTTVTIGFDLTNFTSKGSQLMDQNQKVKSYIPPQPLAFYLQVKSPGCPIQFVHIVVTILPEDGIDARPAPLTMDYSERFDKLRREYTIDQLMSCMISFKDRAAIPQNSILYNEQLFEFETQYSSVVHQYSQSLNKLVKQLSLTDFEDRPQANALVPPDSLMLEFKGKLALSNQYPAEISSKFINFGMVNQENQKILKIKNTSQELDMFVSVCATQINKAFTIEFIGVSSFDDLTQRSDLEPSQLLMKHGLEFRTAISKGMTIMVPPNNFAYYEIKFIPEMPDEVYMGKFTFMCIHQPLLLYRCFRHCIVGYSFIQECIVSGQTRAPHLPALSSSIPIVSKPVIMNNLKLPPGIPGSFSRQSFAFTNQGSGFITLILNKIGNDFVHVSHEIIGLEAGQSTVISVGISFPQDTITNKERYGFVLLENQAGVMFEDSLIFNVNGSEMSYIKIDITAVCSSLDVSLEKVDTEEKIFNEIEPPFPLTLRMAPVSLGSEAARMFSVKNRSLMPVQIISSPGNQRDDQIMYVNPNDIQLCGSERIEMKYVLKALEKYLAQQSYNFEILQKGYIPQHFYFITPQNMSNYSLIEQPKPHFQKLIFQTSIAKRTVELSPKTFNITNVVPYTSVDVPIKIFNSSHCSISYTLEIHEVFNEMSALQHETDQKQIRKYPYVQSKSSGDFLVPNLFNKIFDPESIMNEAQTNRCPQIFIKQNAGAVILPHSSATTILTINPFNTKTVRARVFVKIVEIDQTDRTYSDIVQELEEQAVYVQGTAQAFSKYLENIDKNRMFESRLECTTAYPKFIISDISCPTIGATQLREILNVDHINEFLTGDVTQQERIYTTPCGHRQKLIKEYVNILNTEIEQKQDEPHSIPITHDDTNEQNDENKLLKEFPLILGPDNMHPDKKYFVILTLANPSEVPCEISFDLPKGVELGDCPWVQQLPTTSEQRTMSLLARKIYSVSPQLIQLKPYEKKSLLISYSHIEEGVHELLILAQIKNGRSFFLRLIGSTLAQFEPALIAPIQQRLLPISLGEIMAPRQFIKIINPGQVFVKYRLGNLKLVYDVQSDEQGSQIQNVDAVLKILNKEGVVAPSSQTNLIVQFCPNQVGLVHIRVDMSIERISQQEFQSFKQQNLFFESEYTADLPDESLIGMEKISSIEKQTDQNIILTNVYQPIDIYGYGFVRTSSVPLQILPSFARNGCPTNPGCGAVSVQQSDQRMISQRGLGYCKLSCGRLVMGAVPTFGVVSAIIQISGCSQDCDGDYDWSVDQEKLQFMGLQVKITPQSGTLKQNQTQNVFIQFICGALPAVFLEDIPFKITFNSLKVKEYQFQSQTDGRLPAILANTISSAARVAETAILQQFDPQQLNKAGMDQETRQQHAMLYGVQNSKMSPLSQFMEIPLEDTLWLSFVLHSHKTQNLDEYSHLEHGLKLNSGAQQLKSFTSKQKDNLDLGEEEMTELARIIQLAMRGAVNRLVDSKDDLLQNNALKAKRDAINNLEKANFNVENENIIKLVDAECGQEMVCVVEDVMGAIDQLFVE